ncbi:MAG: D-alanyl-D-alanine carboxypeptidase/D-alanyl-D-alanine-endopeptidase [Chitinophagaceae bacterium]|nr:D-alanyl-D-alanine carboxypeptidase/D-alanyl-D-alanine-endopeptidase [Chitinophagaceae bacterium]
MRRYFLFISFLLIFLPSFSQSVGEKLTKAISELEKDSSLKHAIIGFCVADAKTGKLLFDKNAGIGLAVASTQKVLTNIAAYELLGKEYKFKTELRYSGLIKGNELNGNLFIIGYGDPTLGSKRFSQMNDDAFLKMISGKLRQLGVRRINGDVIADNSRFSKESIPDGWVWEDIGNYYAAGLWAVNWKENSFDLLLKAGDNPGDSVEILNRSEITDMPLKNLLKAGQKGSGDNAFIHLPPDGTRGYVSGTIPAGEKKFVISGAVPNGAQYLLKNLAAEFSSTGIEVKGKFRVEETLSSSSKTAADKSGYLFTVNSPSLDTISYHFLHKSINLYGEALVRTIAYEKTGIGTNEKGIELIKQFYSKNGIDGYSINIIDGSGLSPQNRVTPESLVKALQLARNKTWFGSFYAALPEYNGLKMKSGSIGGARAFTGYSNATNGAEYTFAIIVNNYNGSSSAVVKKMYRLLDILK